MKYRTKPTERGNIGVSRVSFEKAEAQAKAMDEGGNTYCENCPNCINCIGCTNCEGCSYCIRCTNICSSQLVNGWKFGTATNVISLNGLYWPVATNGTRIQIGCKNHTLREWETFTDIEIRNMAPRALSFWITNKDNILALARTRKAR